MVVFESAFFTASQGLISGWKVKDEVTGATSIPSREMKTQIGLVWMQISKTMKQQSLDSKQTEDLMFFSFAKAVRDPSSRDGELWTKLTPDQLTSVFIVEANKTVNDPFHKPFWW